MFLKRLEIHGFKSFPDKIKLQFDHGLTAVVGPNGSGKSNISDAMRWVLGEQSSKTLRGSKMQDVIFGGTQARSPMGYAQVALVIDNSDHKLRDIEAEEVTVSRKLYRSGESEYRINGNNVRLRDIHQLFMDTGLGRDGYSIISQGKISEIVSAKSEQRREIFEEAAGIASHRFKKNEAERKLDRAEENLLRLRDIVQEISSRLDPLRIQSEKASEYLRYSASRRRLEISLWVHTLKKSRDLLRQQEDKLLISQRDLENLEREITDLDEKNEEVFAAMNDCTRRSEAVAAEIAALGETTHQNESESLVLQTEKRHAEETQQRLRGEIDTLDKLGDDTDDKIAAKQSQITASDTAIADKERRIAEIEQQLAALVQENTSAESETQQMTQTLSGYSLELGEIRVRLQSSRDNLTRYTTQRETLAAKRDELKRELDKAERELAEVSQQLAATEETLQSAQNTCDGYALKVESRRKNYERAAQEAETLRQKCEAANNKYKLLGDLKANMEGYAYSVKKVAGAAKEGRLRGVRGPVASLLSVDKQYATALEVALGAAAQNIVVEDERAAKDAIRHLKESRSGRATFLPLSTIKPRRISENGLQNQEGYVGVASDLVRCEQSLRPIADNLLGRTCVVDDLDNAAAMAKKYGYRFRVVTLDGQVVNAGGSFTGGHMSKNAGIFTREAELQELQKTLSSDTQLYREKVTEANKLKEEVTRLDAVMQGAQSEMITAQQDKIRCEGEINRIRQYMEGAQSQMATIARDDAEIEQYLKDLRRDISQLEVESAQTDELYQKCSEKLAAKSAAAKEYADKRQALQEQIADYKVAISGDEKDIRLFNEEIQTLQQAKIDRGAQRQSLGDQIAQSEQAVRDIEEKITSLQEKNTAITADIEQKRNSITEIAAERQGLEKQATDNRQLQRELQSDRDGISRELARLTERRESMQREYDKIIADLFEQYELTRTQAEEEATPVENENESKRELTTLKQKMRALGPVNVEAIEEYAQEKERFEFMSAQIEDVEKSRESLLKLIASLTKEMTALFRDNFHRINREFGRIFKDLFDGGEARLSLTDEEDVLNSGVEIEVAPPGKIIKNLQSLSGGEQAFVAIAIYFAILTVHPSPFCVLDEIEAALDDVNVTKYAGYLRRMSDNTQFIAITHRRGTMEEVDVLYGVTMQEEGVSKLLTLDVSEVGADLGL